MSDENGRVLIVEDQQIYADVYKARLAPEGYQIDTAMDVQTALWKLKEFQPDVVILDLRLQRGDSEEGLSVLREITEYNSEIKVIIVTVEGAIQTARKALELGAYDFIEKKTQGYNELPFRVNQAFEKLQLDRRIADLQRAEIEGVKGYRYGQDGVIVGNSEHMHQLYEQIARVAPTNATVLILGESGTGKELVAHAIHHKSPRADADFVPVACGQTGKELLGSELFGHEKGAFTGADKLRQGKFEQANEGTIFLDELAELDHASQVQLLRVLQERKIERLGGKQTIPVDVRIIGATNKNLELTVKDGAFREDLYHRLNVIQLHVPPLRERKSDIPLLAAHFLTKKCQKINVKKSKGFQESAMALLIGHSWPGNVRELENRIERAIVLATGDWISAADIRTDPTSEFDVENRSLSELVDEYERTLILDALERTEDQKAAAGLLDIPEPTLRYKMDKHGIARSRAKRIAKICDN